MCHQIRCLKAPHVDSMDFGEITEVVPWDILAKDCGQDLDADQPCEPRLFKSHEPWVRREEDRYDGGRWGSMGVVGGRFG